MAGMDWQMSWPNGFYNYDAASRPLQLSLFLSPDCFSPSPLRVISIIVYELS
jgi:hypothetical protein